MITNNYNNYKRKETSFQREKNNHNTNNRSFLLFFLLKPTRNPASTPGDDRAFIIPTFSSSFMI